MTKSFFIEVEVSGDTTEQELKKAIEVYLAIKNQDTTLSVRDCRFKFHLLVGNTEPTFNEKS